MKRIFTAIVLTLSLFAAYGCKEKSANDFIGLQMYSVRSSLNPLEDGLAKIAEAGYSFVEMANYNDEAGLFYGRTPEEFKALCEANGLQVLSSHTNGPNPDCTPMEDCVAWWRRAIEHHAAAIIEEVDRMTKARRKANHESASERDKAIAYHDNVLPVMAEIREHVDDLEMIVDDELWTLPKYRELMFIH